MYHDISQKTFMLPMIGPGYCPLLNTHSLTILSLLRYLARWPEYDRAGTPVDPCRDTYTAEMGERLTGP